MRTKHLLVLLISLLCLPVFAVENYFRPGTEWIMEYTKHNIEEGTSSIIYYRYYMGSEIQIDGETVLPFYSSKYPPIESGTLHYYMKTEGDKVYWRYLDPQYPEWHLMYDFGLQKGETAEIMHMHNNPEARVYYNMTCTGTDLTVPHKEGRWMTLVGEDDHDTAEWILGIGSWRGPLDNTVLWDGGPSERLFMVNYLAETVYAAESTEVKTMEADDVIIRTEGSDIFISNVPNGTSIAIYDANGKVVKNLQAKDNTTQISIETPGLYIVMLGNKSVKVIVN